MQINILDYLELTQQRFPDKIALVDEHNRITYSQLQSLAKRIGTKIAQDNKSEVRRPVIVMADRSLASIVSFMGVVYSGNFYVPIDVATPIERLEQIMKKLNPLAILGEEKSRNLVSMLMGEVTYYSYEEASQVEVDEQLIGNIRGQLIDVDPVYSIFTSGTTGVPKGIVISHKSLIDLAEWLTETFSFDSTEIIGNQTPFYFDASVKDIYMCIKNGMTLHILPKKFFSFPLLLIDYLIENKITTILWATSAINLVANSKVFEKKVPHTLQKIFFAGEIMHAKYLNRWLDYLPEAMYVNLYGPTEITVDCTYYIVNRQFQDDEPIPIGNACRNMEILILNEKNECVQQQELGEICVRGTGVSKGYYNDAQISDNVFVQNPLNPFYRDIIYRTGDIGSYNEYGEIMYSTRRDGQIKHMGYRIELSDIEYAVSSIPEIEDCICGYDHGVGKIVLMYTGTCETLHIIRELSKKLPKHMLPNSIEKQESFLYNANGKIDRNKMMASRTS